MNQQEIIKQKIKKYIICAFAKFNSDFYYYNREYTNIDMMVLFLSFNSLHEFMKEPHTFEHYREILFTPNRYLASVIPEEDEYSTSTEWDREQRNIRIASSYTYEDAMILRLLEKFPEYTKEQLKEHEYRMDVLNYLEILEKFLHFHTSKIPYLVFYEDMQGKVHLEQYFPTDEEWQKYWGYDVKIDNKLIKKYIIGSLQKNDFDDYYNVAKYNNFDVYIVFLGISFLQKYPEKNAQEILQIYKEKLFKANSCLENARAIESPYFTQICTDMKLNAVKFISQYPKSSAQSIIGHFPEYTKEQLENYAYKVSIEDYLRILQELLELYYAQVPYIILYEDEQGKLQCQAYQPMQEEEKLHWQVVPSRDFLDNL